MAACFAPYLFIGLDLSCDYVCGLQAFRVLFDGELHDLSFFELVIIVAGKRRKMDENIVAIFTTYESIPFRCIEPFHDAEQTLLHKFMISIH